MSSGVVDTHNKAAKIGPKWWGAGSQYENEPADPERHSMPRCYWVDGTLGDQTTLAYQAGASAEHANHTVEGRISIDQRFADRILSYTLSDPADPTLESGDATVQFFPAHLEKLLTLLGSYRNAVTIRTPDGGALVITRKMADVPPDRWFGEPEMHVEAPLHPATHFFPKGFGGVHPSFSTMRSVLSGPSDPPPEAKGTVVSSQVDAGNQSTIAGWLWGDPVQMRGGTQLVTMGRVAYPAPAYLTSETEVYVEAPLHPVVESFATGFASVRPSDGTLETASRIVEAAIEKTAEREIEVDDTDGSLSFELRLDSGLLVIGELSLVGNLHANVYNDRHPNASAGIEEIWVKHLPQTSAADLIALF